MNVIRKLNKLSNNTIKTCLLTNYRYAGHSKWANIKHIKAINDAKKSESFTKFARQIRVAIQGIYYYNNFYQYPIKWESCFISLLHILQ